MLWQRLLPNFAERLMKAVDERAGDDLVGDSFVVVEAGKVVGSPLAKRLAPVLSALVPDFGVTSLDAEEKISQPLLVLHGTDDRICPLARSVMVHKAVSSADTTLRRHPGLYHEVFNEPEREQILTDLIFLAAHLPSNGSASHSAT